MKSYVVWGVIIIAFIFGNIIYFSEGDLKLVEVNPKPTSISLPTKQSSTVTIEDTTVGSGTEAKKDSTVVVHYKGTLNDGTSFDNSYDRNEPLTVQLGQGSVIKGWDQGIPGMKTGGKRKLTIPSDLAYGAEGRPPTIPPNSILIFEIELLEIK